MGLNKGYENIDIELISITKNPFKTFFDWYKVTWESMQNDEFDINNKKHIQICKDVLDYKALPSPQETIQIQFKIKNLSRVALAQITRGRVGWVFNVKSQMPEAISHNVTIPLNIIQNPKYKKRIQEIYLQTEKLYNDLINDKIPFQDARYITLHGQTTTLIANANLSALRSFYARRACNGLTDELNYVCRLLKFKIIKATKDDPSWKYIYKYLDSSCVFKKQCNNYDKVMGNCGRYPGNNIGRPTCEFKKSALYFELKRMNKRLLFANENKIINGDSNGN